MTVVVPNYNGARFLRGTLASLLGQSYADVELIFLDNQSQDDSVDIAESLDDGRLQIVRAESHVSMAENWNRAFGMAQSEMFLLAHADDIYDPEYLTEMVPLLQSFGNAAFVHCAVVPIDEDGIPYHSPQEQYKQRFWPDAEPYHRDAQGQFRVLRKGNYILAPSVLFHAHAISKIGCFNAEFQFVTDWEYWLRAAAAGFSAVGTHRPLVKYRRHRQSGTKNHEATLRRYCEEIAMADWIAREGYRLGWLDRDSSDYTLVMNTIMHEFIERLRMGEKDSARNLLEFGRKRIPGFCGSFRDQAMRAASLAGGFGGRMLHFFERMYLVTARSKIV